MTQETYYSGITYFLSIALLFVWGILLLIKFINRKKQNEKFYDYWGDKAEFINCLGVVGLIIFMIYSSYKSFSITFYSVSQSVLIICDLINILIYFLFEYKIKKNLNVSIKKHKIVKFAVTASTILLLFISYMKCTY